MANELRVRTNNVGGQVEDGNSLADGRVGLTAAATTMISAGLAAAPVIGTTQHWAIVLDPDHEYGAPEIAYLTAHTAAATGTTGVTLARGQEGTTQRDHPQDTYWVHAPTAKDYTGVVARQGGSVTDWSSSGTTTQALSSRVIEQVGALPYSGLNSGGTVALVFPVAFAYPPVITAITGPTFTADTNVVPSVTVLSATGATFIIWSRTGVNGLGGTVHWRAIGEAT